GDTSGTSGAAGMTGTQGGMSSAASAKGTTAERSGAAGAMSRRGEAGTRGTSDAMTRSEERMHVGVERHESGRARLRKYVVTEEVQQTVPVRHEEVRVEREPITDANRQEAMSGPSFKEDQHEVTLHEERPVVSTEAVPVERVRMTTEEKVTNETVRGRVRKERIEAETEMTDESGRKDRGDTPGRGRDMPGRDRER
ncbi:YsnF/AvaK domain-containing protein, partial [Streptomyces thermocarboxydus]|uniref:YsnF/AvaK domain-containing protein n=1 Tax=Streptomyces thermocarboxydus TaxID=59299 RepID=UPI0031F7850B